MDDIFHFAIQPTALRRACPVSVGTVRFSAQDDNTDEENGTSPSAFGGAHLRALGGVRPPTSD